MEVVIYRIYGCLAEVDSVSLGRYGRAVVHLGLVCRNDVQLGHQTADPQFAENLFHFVVGSNVFAAVHHNESAGESTVITAHFGTGGFVVNTRCGVSVEQVVVCEIGGLLFQTVVVHVSRDTRQSKSTLGNFQDALLFGDFVVLFFIVGGGVQLDGVVLCANVGNVARSSHIGHLAVNKRAFYRYVGQSVFVAVVSPSVAVGGQGNLARVDLQCGGDGVSLDEGHRHIGGAFVGVDGSCLADDGVGIFHHNVHAVVHLNFHTVFGS